jgi:hypothetical protein
LIFLYALLTQEKNYPVFVKLLLPSRHSREISPRISRLGGINAGGVDGAPRCHLAVKILSIIG